MDKVTKEDFLELCEDVEEENFICGLESANELVGIARQLWAEVERLRAENEALRASIELCSGSCRLPEGEECDREK